MLALWVLTTQFPARLYARKRRPRDLSQSGKHSLQSFRVVSAVHKYWSVYSHFSKLGAAQGTNIRLSMFLGRLYYVFVLIVFVFDCF